MGQHLLLKTLSISFGDYLGKNYLYKMVLKLNLSFRIVNPFNGLKGLVFIERNAEELD